VRSGDALAVVKQGNGTIASNGVVALSLIRLDARAPGQLSRPASLGFSPAERHLSPH
jgi:hypothetical protein